MKRIVGGLIIFWALFSFSLFLSLHKKRTLNEKVNIIIEKGKPCLSVLDELDRIGVIKNKLIIYLILKVSGKSKSIKAGEYEFYGKISDIDVIKKILRGGVKRYRVTIPEGSNIYEIARIVFPFCQPDDFLSLVRSEDFIRKYRINSPSLEGFLFPDTYFFEKSQNCEKVVDAMVKRFFVEWADFERRAEEIGMSMEEVIILASIIEKETGLKEEMPLISAVFHNRLKKNMFLQADPSVIYGFLPDFDGNLKKEHLKLQNPYNTYRRKGLPPTPISNPGRDAILSALYPADVPYLYFVSKNDGSHVFTKTLKEHNYYVNLYQRGKK